MTSKTPRADTMQRAAIENFTSQESAVRYCHAVACNLESELAAMRAALESLDRAGLLAGRSPSLGDATEADHAKAEVRTLLAEVRP